MVLVPLSPTLGTEDATKTRTPSIALLSHVPYKPCIHANPRMMAPLPWLPLWLLSDPLQARWLLLRVTPPPSFEWTPSLLV